MICMVETGQQIPYWHDLYSLISSGSFLSPPWANHKVNSPRNSWQISKRIHIVSPATISHHNSLFLIPTVDKKELQQWCTIIPFIFPYFTNLSTGIKVLKKTVHLVISIRQNLVGYTNSSFPLANLANLLIMFSTSLMKTRVAKSISRSLSVHSVLLVGAVWRKN